MSDTPTLADDPEAYWNNEASPWVANQALMDEMLAPITERLIEAAAPVTGEHVIDVGCGCGDTTIKVGERVGPTGSVLGVDISEPMLARATERASGMPHVTLQASDATTHVFDPARADLVLSRYGVMFFGDPAAAFANLRAALRPGGRLCVVCWQAAENNPWMSTPLRALDLPPPEPSPEGAPGPLSLADPEATGAMLEAVGFTDVRFESVEGLMTVGDTPDDVLRIFTKVGPLSSHLASLEESQRPGVIERVRAFLEAGWGTDAANFDSASWLVRATIG